MLGGIQTIDIVLFLGFAGFFVLGFAQGTIRRLIGIGTILFSFFLAANLTDPVGGFFGNNWTQFPKPYSFMLAFGLVFVTLSVVFALVVQGFYHPQPLFEKYRFLDEIIGGILGIIEFGIILGAAIVILDSYFAVPANPAFGTELPVLRSVWTALDSSQIVAFYRDTLIPGFFTIFSFLLPSGLVARYPSGG